VPLLESVSPVGLAAALVLPWLAGALAVRPAVADWPAALGYGFFAGQLIVIALIWTWDALGLGLAFAPMAAVPALLVAAFARPAWRAGRPTWRRPDWPATAWLGLALLLTLVALRFGMMAQEVAVRPLFAWDAWMNWVPKAVVWFHHEELTPFVLPPAWLATPDAEVYSLGNWRASGYPPGVPLMLLWTMLGAGTADHTLLYLPWLVAPAAFALALWSRLREAGAGPILAMLSVYLFVSTPLVATHVMLVGYADLWLGLYFSLGVLAVEALQRRRRIGWGVLALAMAGGCAVMKTPGLVFGVLVAGLAGLVALALPARWWRRLVLAGLAGIAAILLLGVLPLFDGEGVLPLPFFLPDLRLQPQPLLPILVEQLFGYAQWHLLWLLLPLAGMAALRTRGRVTLAGPAVAGLVAAAGLLMFVFGMTHYFRQADNLLTLNRTLLYLVPLAAYLVGAWLAMARRADRADA
jgi:hypothetical protein